MVQPLVELYYKDDELGDPFISDEQALMLETVEDPSYLQVLKALALEVNTHLGSLFAKVDIELIDFKLEFGFNSEGDLLLADEITLDSCRLWEMKTGKNWIRIAFVAT